MKVSEVICKWYIWAVVGYVIPLKVEYSLTEIGKKFHPVIDALQNWGYEYIEYLEKDTE